jgi:hypothetical protein
LQIQEYIWGNISQDFLLACGAGLSSLRTVATRI